MDTILKALEFYADTYNYCHDDLRRPEDDIHFSEDTISQDCGQKARVVLAEYRQGKEMIMIPKKKYDELMQDAHFLGCLHAAGVDNWDGYEEAREMLREDQKVN